MAAIAYATCGYFAAIVLGMGLVIGGVALGTWVERMWNNIGRS